MDPANPYTYVGGGAIAGVGLLVLWLFVTERVVPGATYRRRLEESREKDVTIERLHTLLEDRALGVLERTMTLLQDVTELMRDLRRGSVDR